MRSLCGSAPAIDNELQTYANLAVPLLAISGATVLAAYVTVNGLKGPTRKGVAAASLDTMAAARTFKDSRAP